MDCKVIKPYINAFGQKRFRSDSWTMELRKHTAQADGASLITIERIFYSLLHYFLLNSHLVIKLATSALMSSMTVSLLTFFFKYKASQNFTSLPGTVQPVHLFHALDDVVHILVHHTCNACHLGCRQV